MEGLGNQEDLKHVCKRCFKKFRCGKSLGGHMRSHVMAAKAQKRKPKNNEEKEDDNGVELSRETPKQQQGDDGSLLINSNEQLMEVQSCTENGDGFSSVHLEIDEKMKEAARTILMLSRDDNFNLVAEPSHSNRSENKTATTGNNKIKIVFNSKPKKAKGHKCPFCTRVFKSGQALGGHKRSHLMGGGSVGTIDKERKQTPQLQESQPQPQPQTPPQQPPQQQPQQQRRRQFLIDLNLPCIMEE